ncbi:hypothetical protein N568_0101275 [Lactococcus garvieae TRF1]|uniref:Uncharacterized protein n=1 Tax=Lactococcus garvieae TRF1 TaxID=1380772 RepID=V8AS00_9LACT|nr:hypothetical protein N568_0101275 [Lactococcus garvieae TRF1]
MKLVQSKLIGKIGTIILIIFVIISLVLGLTTLSPEDKPTLENTTGTKNWEAKTEKYILNSYTESTEGKIVLDVKDKGEMTFLSSEVNIISSIPPLKQMTVSIQYYSFVPVVRNGKIPLRGTSVVDEIKIKGDEKELPKQTMTWGEIVNDKKIGYPDYGKSHSKIFNTLFKSEVANLTKSIPKEVANKISKTEKPNWNNNKETVVARPFVIINK